MKWSIYCHICKRGCHNHQGFQPSKCKFLSPGKTIMSIWQPSVTSPVSSEKLGDSRKCKRQPSATSHHSMWGIKDVNNQEAGFGTRKLRFIWKEWIQGAQMFALSIHRRTLNSFIWDIWLSLINNNLLLFRLTAPCCKLLCNLIPPSTSRETVLPGDAFSWAWSSKIFHQITLNFEVVHIFSVDT